MEVQRTLIHLVSEQTIQNLIPILAFRPQRVVQVLSRGNFRKQAEGIEAAVGVLRREQPGYQDYIPSFELHELTESDPTPARVSAELEVVIEPGTIVNYTGGTKMMSVAAFQLAQERQASAVYCDTHCRRFVWSPGRSAVAGPEFDQLSDLLTVMLLVTAHNPDHKGLSSGEATPELIGFAKEAWKFKRAAPPVLSKYLDDLRTYFRPSGGRIPSSRSELDRMLQQALPQSQAPSVRDYLRAAARSGLLREQGGRFYLVCKAGNKREIRKAVERTANLLNGSWLELFVMGQLSNFPEVGDVKWSLEPGYQRRQAVGETDVVCVDRRLLALRVISCKESLRGRSPLEHMEALVQRARSLGGSMARPTLALLNLDEADEKAYRTWARVLHLDLWPGDEIASPFRRRGGVEK